MTVVPIGDYKPDVPAYLGTHATLTSNVFPRSDGSDGPILGPVVLSAALAAAANGSFVVRDADTIVYLIAGTATDLYLLNGAAWTTKSGAVYASDYTNSWKMTQFGTRILATQINNAIQTYTLGGGNFANLAAAAPMARYIATIEPGFVMTAYINDGTLRPARLRWSAINDATSWPTIGSSAAAAAQSDDQDLPDGAPITGLVDSVGGAAGVVFTEKAVYRIEYIGAPQIFAFRKIEKAAGCICPNGIAVVNGAAYYISDDGFQRFDGQNETHIGFGRVDATFLADIDGANLHRVRAIVDPRRSMIIWAYPNTHASSGNPNRWLIYSYAIDRWRFADATEIACEIMCVALATGYNLDNMDAVLPLAIDGYPGLLVDTPLYSGGFRVLAGFDTSHRLVSFTGDTLAARVETGETDASGRRVFVRGIRPLTDATAVTAAVGHRNQLSGAVTYTTSTAPGVDSVCPQRIDTRYARARMDIPAGSVWTYLQGADVMFDPAGFR